MNATIAIATRYAWRFVGRPYRWGGDDPMAGFDCSGLCIEILQSVGILPRRFDTTAHGLFHKFPRAGYGAPGCLVFWHGSVKSKIIHVEFCIGDGLAIGASGGGSRTTTTEDAIRQNAFVKIRPVASRDGVAGYADPFSGGRF